MDQPPVSSPSPTAPSKILFSHIALILLAVYAFFLILGNVTRANGGSWMVLIADAAGLAALVMAIIGRVKKERAAYLITVIILLIVIALLTLIITNPPR
jgi:hypothetical protein